MPTWMYVWALAMFSAVKYVLLVMQLLCPGSGLRAPPTTQPPTLLEQKLADLNLRAVDVPKDNSCQFHALIHQLVQHELVAQSFSVTELRQRVSSFLLHSGHLPMEQTDTGTPLQLWQAAGASSALQWAHDARRVAESAWGDEITLLAVSAMFGVRIRVVSDLAGAKPVVLEPPAVWGVAICPRPLWLTLAHRHEHHYLSTEPLSAWGVPQRSQTALAKP